MESKTCFFFVAHMRGQETSAIDCGWMGKEHCGQIAGRTRSLVWTIMACPKIELSLVQYNS